VSDCVDTGVEDAGKGAIVQAFHLKCRSLYRTRLTFPPWEGSSSRHVLMEEVIRGYRTTASRSVRRP
jgi:hypothetical protein